MMRTFILLMLVSAVASAQRITIDAGMEKFDDEYFSAYRVFIPYANKKTVSREWVDFVKDHKGKARNDDVIIAKGVLLPAVTRDTLTIYATIIDNADGATINIAFIANDVAISPDTHVDQSKTIMDMLHNFALPIAKQGHKLKLEAATKLVEEKEREADDLAKQNERMKADNEKMQNRIHDNERAIKDNETKINAAKTEIENRKGTRDIIKSKEKELE